jgi:hypothetical protein
LSVLFIDPATEAHRVKKIFRFIYNSMHFWNPEPPCKISENPSHKEVQTTWRDQVQILNSRVPDEVSPTPAS